MCVAALPAPLTSITFREIRTTAGAVVVASCAGGAELPPGRRSMTAGPSDIRVLPRLQAQAIRAA